MYVHELRLFTRQLEQQRQFYSGILGLPLRESSAEEFTLEVGASALTLSAHPRAEPLPLYNHFAFNIPENLFAAAKVWLAGRTELLTNPEGQDEFFFESWNAHAVYFADPEGNIGEFIARHNLPSEHTEPFSGRHILNISEIGLPLDDVPEFAWLLQAQMECPIYRGEMNEMFMPMGDENGLFILAKRGRTWYPNGTMPAVPTPLEVLVSTEGGKRFRIDGLLPYRINKS